MLPFQPGTKLPPRLSGLERQLKPWQVQTLAWAADMESSTLGSWLLSDEIGLGKRMSALSRLVESGRQEMAAYKQAPEAHQFYRMDH